MKNKLVVLTGAGISAESGIKTFRDSDGLWENYRIEDVATIEAFERNPKLVLEFYNKRREDMGKVSPNRAHRNLKFMEKDYDITIITQNVDDLHEKAGSKNVLHLHGELSKMRGDGTEGELYNYNRPIAVGNKDRFGNQLRPHVVLFGENVPNLPKAIEMARTADIFVIIGTSLQVYPAANILDYIPHETPTYYIDPGEFDKEAFPHMDIIHIKEKATTGTDKLRKLLRENEDTD